MSPRRGVNAVAWASLLTAALASAPLAAHAQDPVAQSQDPPAQPSPPPARRQDPPAKSPGPEVRYSVWLERRLAAGRD